MAAQKIKSAQTYHSVKQFYRFRNKGAHLYGACGNGGCVPFPFIHRLSARFYQLRRLTNPLAEALPAKGMAWGFQPHHMVKIQEGHPGND
ncbi:hypothetical protein NPIL_684791 [Nephila pilipes]|uniref:Uncharacterized protein n=1 Tax=Nephila pilipes TaxID=299642 RepID=A0A8X6NYE6_NEPPI|nr:hypothetical protein NPIL_684791 [Nephila pilipes]